ncbi:MAG: ATP synthase subunit I [Steroidobacteraceae bacterium]
MADVVFMLPALMAGLVLGGFYFGGLWWTVIKGLSSPAPALWFLGSLLLRMGVTMAGFYFAGGDRWTRWIGCLSGFIVARLVVKTLTRPKLGPDHAQALGTRYAP